MNDEEMHGGSEGHKVDQKPMFTITPSAIFTNLHKAALEKAIQALGRGFLKMDGGFDINKIILNSAMSDDGRFMSDDVISIVKSNGTMKTKRFGSGKYEVGIIFQVTKFPDLKDLPDDPKKKQAEIDKLTEKAMYPLRQDALTALNEYFKWFAGTDGNAIQANDMEEFKPSYEGGKVEFEKGGIKNLFKKGEKFRITIKDVNGENSEYTQHRGDVAKGNPNHTRSDENGGDYKPRIGFKVKYNISNKGS